MAKLNAESLVNMPFSQEDLEETLQNEGTLYDWLDANKEQKIEVSKDKTPATAGDYDALPKER